MANDEWILNGPTGVVSFLPEGLFDYSPCLIELWEETERRKGCFKYYNMWGKSDKFKSIVIEIWRQPIQGCHMFQLIKKLKKLKHPLKKLNNDGYGNIDNTALVAKTVLENIQKQLYVDPRNVVLQAEERVAAQIYKDLDEAKNSFLAQKAKVKWVNLGDDNTRFFHSKIKARRAQNKVLKIKDMHGVVYYEVNTIEQAFIKYYQEVLGSYTQVIKVCPTVVKKGKTATSEQAKFMLQEMTKTEVKEALFSIPVEKAHGPDGYSSGFYRDSYDIIGGDVVRVVLEFFTNGKILHQINAIVLTLIPKLDCPSTVQDFRPIACCNVIYKCISKIICKRLAGVLADLISMNQSAFIKDMEIVDNILICQDLVRLYGRKNCSPRAMLKVDLKKAYDTIEWAFIRDILAALEFPEQMINWIMLCVTTTSYTISLNGSHFGYFKASGLCINKAKSDMYLNGIDANMASQIVQLVGFKMGQFPFRCLGIPISSKILGIADCNKVVDKIVAMIGGWGFKHLSYAGRLVLVKVVLTQLHAYWARIFLLPKGVIQNMESIYRNYLWAGNAEYKHSPPVAWETCCLPKK
ncbi:uncharacterized protein LOC141619458 [Silene latifolia]|uniref:uncharacterized protein LOC141619458 n=1 Tax=Silene latifolia TaxID=37657 RepID=UPI003D78AA86